MIFFQHVLSNLAWDTRNISNIWIIISNKNKLSSKNRLYKCQIVLLYDFNSLLFDLNVIQKIFSSKYLPVQNQQ